MRNVNDYTHLLWVHKSCDAFDGQTGFVPCTQAEYDKHVDTDIAQDPRHGANHLREIESDGTYQTKVLTPKRGPGRPRKVTEDSDEAGDDEAA